MDKVNIMIRTNLSSIFYPDYVIGTILELDPSRLKALRLTHIAFDIDETLVPRRHDVLPDEYRRHLQAIADHGIGIFIASNTSRDLDSITKLIKAQLIKPSKLIFKPRRAYFQKIIGEADVPPQQIAMVGDRIVNDIVGANRAGLVSILVKPVARKQSKLYLKYLKFVSVKSEKL